MATPNPAEGPDPFSRVLPLPFRLELELILGFWFWALNLHGFSRLHIDIFSLIRLPPRPSDDEPAPLHSSVYRLAGVLTAIWAAGISLFWLRTRGGDEGGSSGDRVLAEAWIPNLVFVLLLAALVTPRYGWFMRPVFGSRNSAGLARLWAGLKRVSTGGIAKTKPEMFGDVLLADALTSYAKPLSEVVVAFCMFFRGISTTDFPDRKCGHELLVPLMIAWPFFIRLRQCFKVGQWANALKYATAFPVVILSTMARGDPGLTLAWNLAAIVNSSYSFWWDVSMDWDLTLLSRKQHQSPFGLRQQRVFPKPTIYYGVVIFDIILRFMWSMKLSLHLVYLDGIEGGIFLMEILELSRRWVWVYFRVETEWVRSTPSASIEL